MKAISLWQPWASLWCSGVKIHETRHWPTSYRGWLLVHAAKRKIDDLEGDRLGEICDGVFGHHYGQELPLGALVGMVNIVNCKPTIVFPADFRETDDYECGDYGDDRFAWEAKSPKLFEQAIAYRGAQGFFQVPDNILPKQLIPDFALA